MRIEVAGIVIVVYHNVWPRQVRCSLPGTKQEITINLDTFGVSRPTNDATVEFVQLASDIVQNYAPMLRFGWDKLNPQN